MQVSQSFIPRTILLFFCALIGGNLLALNLWVLQNKSKLSVQSVPVAIAVTPTATPSPTTTPTPTITPSPQPTTSKISTSPIREIFIPIGTGTGNSDDWKDVDGLKIYVDSTKYGKIKTTVFEASVHVSNADQFVYVRLFNETDKHPVWFSELYFPDGRTATFLVSQPITLDTGNKLYKVQMKTQLKATTNLDQARIHLTLE